MNPKEYLLIERSLFYDCEMVHVGAKKFTGYITSMDINPTPFELQRQLSPRQAFLDWVVNKSINHYLNTETVTYKLKRTNKA